MVRCMSEVKDAVKEFAGLAGAVAALFAALAANVAPIIIGVTLHPALGPAKPNPFMDALLAAWFCLAVLVQVAVQLKLARLISGPGAGLAKAATYAAAAAGASAAFVWLFGSFYAFAAAMFVGFLALCFVAFCLKRYEAAAAVNLPISGALTAVGIMLAAFGLYPLWSVPWIFQLKAMPKAAKLAPPRPAHY